MIKNYKYRIYPNKEQDRPSEADLEELEKEA